MNSLTKVKNLFLTEQNRWPLWIPVGFGTGIGLYYSCPFEPFFLASLLVTGFFLLISFYSRYAVPLLIVAFGFSVATMRTLVVDTQLLERPTKKIMAFGVIEQIEHLPNRTRLIIDRMDYKDSPSYFKKRPQKVRLTTYQDLAFEPGQKISFKANLFPLSYPSYPGGFDYRRYCYFQGIGAVGRLSDITIQEQTHTNWLNSIRHTLSEKLRTMIPGQEGEIATALITGDRAGISLKVRDHFSGSGLAHILAISGLHLSLVAGIFFVLIRGGCALFPSFAERFDTKKIAAFFVILASATYMCIAGFGIPVQRAFCMIFIVMLGILFDRNPISLRLVAIASFLILCVRPESLLTPSFQLSFAAVTALVALYESYWGPLNHWLQRPSRLKRLTFYLGGVLVTTLVATIATTPYTIATFQTLTLVSVIGNILAIPLTAFIIMPLCILAVLSLVGGGLSLVYIALGESINALMTIARYTSSLPGATLSTPLPPPSYLLLITLGGLWLCLWKGKMRFLGIPVIILGFLTLGSAPKPDLLIAPYQKGIGVAKEDTLYLSKSHFDPFLIDQWSSYLGASHVDYADPSSICDQFQKIQHLLKENKIKKSPYSWAIWIKKDEIILKAIKGDEGRPWG